MSLNRLQDQKSLYLLQHKDHPVNWWPYTAEAIAKAQAENKPIFLSIGYSSCHWCHVMAHESFENTKIAEILNDNFICIKVDREEFPDLDQYYQMACQLFSGSGGWPLNAFCLPDMSPYFVGTYFPPRKRGEQGPPAFPELITELSSAFKEAKDQVLENAKGVVQKIQEGLVPEGKVDFEGHFPVPEAIINAISEFKDAENGGYGQAPKFPNFAFYEWALEQMLEGMIPREQGDHIIKSLELMLMGGICDHARGGVHRYSTDNKWIVPHFEKMLYDQAGFLKVLSKLSLIHPSPLVFDAILNTLDYLEREMLADEKYFFASQDADSEGVEGLYFCYTLEEFEAILHEDEELSKNSEKVLSWFALTQQGNYNNELNVIALNPEKKDEYYNREGWDLIRKVRLLIAEDRKQRIPPSTDTKGIASWNFMLLSSLVDIVQYCTIDVIKGRAFKLIHENLDGVFNTFLIAKEADSEGGKVKVNHSTTLEHSIPYLEDYITFCDSQLRMFELTGNALFKDNFLNTMNFVETEFIEDNKVFTRPTSLTDQFAHANAVQDCYDNSFRAPLATFVFLMRKAALLTGDASYEEKYAELFDRIKHDALKNPISCGETLRALTYPNEALRVLKFPQAWVDEQKFNQFRAYFMPRFVFDAQTKEQNSDDTWQVCRFDACELNGKGLEDFLKTLIPQQDLEESE